MRPAARFFVDPFLLVDRLPVGHCACAAGGSAVTVSARARERAMCGVKLSP